MAPTQIPTLEVHSREGHAAKNILAGIELMHMIRKVQLLMDGCIELTFSNQFYAPAGKIRHVLGTGIRSYPKHIRQPGTRQTRKFFVDQ